MTSETLWDFAAECYARAGVAESCLRLQDSAGADVNMLLTAAWLAHEGLSWQHEDVHALMTHCSDWRERCILPLRDMRRFLKNESENSAFYTQVKALELEAEIQQLQKMQAKLLATTLISNIAGAAVLCAHNLQIYFECLDDSPAITDADQQTLLRSLYSE